MVIVLNGLDSLGEPIVKPGVEKIDWGHILEFSNRLPNSIFIESFPNLFRLTATIEVQLPKSLHA